MRMRKLDVVILKKDADIVSKEILGFGDFEVLPIDSFKAESYALKRESLEEISTRFISYKRRLVNIEQFFGQSKEKETIPEDRNFMDEMTIKNTIKEMENDIINYNAEMDDLAKRRHDIQIKLNSIEFFGNLSTNGYADDPEHFFMGFGSIPVSHFRTFMDSISLIPSVVMNVGMVEGENMVFFSVPKSARDQLERILSNVHYKDYGIPQDVKGSIKSNIVKYGFEMTMTHDEEMWLEEKHKKMSARFNKLIGLIYASIDYHLAMAKLRGQMVSTETVHLFSGWVPVTEISRIKTAIETITAKKCLFIEENAETVFARDGIIPPTKLNHAKPFRIFQQLVGLFGTPEYRELDPTVFATVIYIVMYGAMFGDIGHGLLLSALGGLFLIFRKFRKLANFGFLLFWVGISSAVFGLLYGSIFGMEDLFAPFWMSPIHNIMTILVIAVVFGSIVISLGLVLSIINSIRRKEWSRLFFSSSGIAGLIFYWGILLIGYSLFNGINIPVGVYLIPVIGALAIWSENTFEYLISKKGKRPSWGMGFFDVFETSLAYLSNTISFMRVGAFAINHGALMLAVFTLAGLAASPLWRGVILLIGNVIVIALEGLIVGIQALRLEFYEFFVKFFRADGKKFEALDIYKR